MGGAIVGDIVFPILIIIHLLWDWKHGGFRGIVLQILGALCLGTVINAVVNAKGYDAGKVATLIFLYGLLCAVFYWWAWVRRHRKPGQKQGDPPSEE